MNQVDTSTDGQRGTWWQRVLVWSCSILLTLLVFWLLGFVLKDIGRLPGPSWSQFETERLEPRLRATDKDLADQVSALERDRENILRRQQLLRDSTASSQKTLGQLIELLRISMEQDRALPDEQQQALVDSQQLFLANQRRDQELNESLATLQEQIAALRERQRVHSETFSEAQRKLRAEFRPLEQWHRLKVAAIKVGVLTPLLLVGAFLFARHRGSAYAPMVYALDLALLVKTFQVMHEYFPSEYFKYILIVSSLAVIGGVLARLLGMVARPSRDARFKQYREAYESFVCPICRYPIRRGPLRFMSWTSRSLRRVSQPVGSDQNEPYTCPSCATPLFAKCAQCGVVRHALLPACEHCGATQDV